MNSKLFLTALAVFSSIVLHAQCVSVSLTQGNIAYEGIDNPLEVALGNLPANQVLLTTDNGQINTDNGHYLWHPQRPGFCRILLKDKKTQAVLLTINCKVKHLPDPVPYLGTRGIRSGEIKKKDFIAQTGVNSLLENFDFNIQFKVMNYTVYRFAKGQMGSTSILNSGNLFTEPVKALIQKAEPGDVYIIEQITGKYQEDKRPRVLSTLSFRIVE